MGEEGGDCVLKAAVLVSNPWNLETGNQFLQRSWLGREVYSKTMGRNIKKVFEESVIDEVTSLTCCSADRSHAGTLNKYPKIHR